MPIEMPEDQKQETEVIEETDETFAHAWLNDVFVFYDTFLLKIMVSTTFKNNGGVKIRTHDIGCGAVRGKEADQLINYFTEIAKEKEKRKRQNKGD